MTNAYEDLTSRLKELSSGWAGYTALGSFALYVAGYLALRFHLTALGVGTDLAVLDERYIFTGARFLIYLGATLPSTLFLMIVSAVILLVLWAVLAFIRWVVLAFFHAITEKLQRFIFLKSVAKFFAPLCAFVSKLLANVRLDTKSKAVWLAVSGICAATIIIQMVMKQCFEFSNLLLAECMPEPSWFRGLLLDPSQTWLYFIVLVAGVMLTGGLWYAARHCVAQTAWSRALTNLLAVLVAIQFLLLPVNYGVLIVDKTLPKVADLGGVESLREGQEAWLVWEGKEGVTWFVRSTNPCGDTPTIQRKLVTLPQKELKKTQIIRYDPLAQCLTAGLCAAP